MNYVWHRCTTDLALEPKTTVISWRNFLKNCPKNLKPFFSSQSLFSLNAIVEEDSFVLIVEQIFDWHLLECMMRWELNHLSDCIVQLMCTRSYLKFWLESNFKSKKDISTSSELFWLNKTIGQEFYAFQSYLRAYGEGRERTKAVHEHFSSPHAGEGRVKEREHLRIYIYYKVILFKCSC